MTTPANAQRTTPMPATRKVGKKRMKSWTGYAIIDEYGEAASHQPVFVNRTGPGGAVECYNKISQYQWIGRLRIARVKVTELAPTRRRRK